MQHPPLLGGHVVTAFRELLDNELNVLALDDFDLIFLLNKTLRRQYSPDIVSLRKFRRCKEQCIALGMDNEYCETDEEMTMIEDFDPVYRALYREFCYALIDLKKSLVEKMLNDDKAWRRYQWLLERKFKEWNLRWSNMEVVREQEYITQAEKEEEPEVRIKLVPEYVGAEDMKRIRAERAARKAEEDELKFGWDVTPPPAPNEYGYIKPTGQPGREHDVQGTGDMEEDEGQM